MTTKTMADAAETAAKLGITAEQVADAWEAAGVPVQRVDALTLALREIVAANRYTLSIQDDGLDVTFGMAIARAATERAIAIVREASSYVREASSYGASLGHALVSRNEILAKLEARA